MFWVQLQLQIANSSIGVSIVTDLQAKSGVRLTESYETGKIGSVEIPLSTIKTVNRDILISYLDEDLLIARDIFGTPEILRRKEFPSITDSSADSNVPSA